MCCDRPETLLFCILCGWLLKTCQNIFLETGWKSTQYQFLLKPTGTVTEVYFVTLLHINNDLHINNENISYFHKLTFG